MIPSEIASRAAELVGGNRAQTHGNYRTNHQNIAALWTTWLRLRFPQSPVCLTITAHDVAVMMNFLKCARTLTGTHNVDDAVDACGYSAIAGALREHDAGIADKILAGETKA